MEVSSRPVARHLLFCFFLPALLLHVQLPIATTTTSIMLSCAVRKHVPHISGFRTRLCFAQWRLRGTATSTSHRRPSSSLDRVAPSHVLRVSSRCSSSSNSNEQARKGPGRSKATSKSPPRGTKRGGKSSRSLSSASSSMASPENERAVADIIGKRTEAGKKAGGLEGSLVRERDMLISEDAGRMAPREEEKAENDDASDGGKSQHGSNQSLPLLLSPSSPPSPFTSPSPPPSSPFDLPDDHLAGHLQRLYAGSQPPSPSSSLGLDTLHPYWLKRLSMLQRPAARALVSQILPTNPLGFDAGPTLSQRRGTLYDFVLTQKKAHPEKVILTRVGEFYETYGVDAIMLVEYAGLNPMGSKAKAGCPVKNVQATLDGLTSAGLTVAVIEEISDLDSASPRTSKLKSRLLSQIVSPGASTYLYDCCLRPDDVEYPENRPFLGLLNLPSNGYTLVEVHVDAQTARITEGLTEEGVKMMLLAGGMAEPLYTQAVERGLLRVLLPGGGEVERRELFGHVDSRSFYQALVQALGRDLEIEALADQVHVRVAPPLHSRPRPIPLATALQIGLVANSAVPDLVPHLLPAHALPLLRVHSSRFLRRWLLTPPPYHLADAMQALCRHLARPRPSSPASPTSSTPSSTPVVGAAPPLCKPVGVGKMVAMLSMGQGNVPLFRDLAGCLQGLLVVLGEGGKEKGGTSVFREVLPSLRAIVAYESGMEVAEEELRVRGKAALAAIEDVVIPATEEDLPSLPSSFASFTSTLASPLPTTALQGATDRHDVDANGGETLDPSIKSTVATVPAVFFERNEETFRNTVRPTHPLVLEPFARVKETAAALSRAVAQDFDPGADVTVDPLNNAVMMKKKPAPSFRSPLSPRGPSPTATSTETSTGYIHPTDRHRKPLSSRYTTARVETALNDYLQACGHATVAVRRALQSLSSTLRSDLPTMITATHMAVVLQAAAAHVAAAKQKGWTLPALLSFSDSDCDGKEGDRGLSPSTPAAPPASHPSAPPSRPSWRMRLPNLTPYWLSRNSGGVSSSVDLDGLFLLTAPNMSGKSTLMRSIAVAALLGNAGLFVPCMTGKEGFEDVREGGGQGGLCGKRTKFQEAGSGAGRKSVVIPRFDHLFLRTASYDVPSEGKSAFALEMDDVRVLLRDSTSRSLVFLDELGKGTSAREGAALSGALIEALDAVPVTGIFATHLHEIFDLPLQTSDRVRWKRMGFEEDVVEGGEEGPQERRVRWTYQLEDGRCLDSMAWYTARKFGIPETILARARVLGGEFDVSCRGRGDSKEDGKGGGWRDSRGGLGEGIGHGEDKAREAGCVSDRTWVEESMTLEGAAEVLASIFRGYHSSSSNSLPPSLLPSLPPFQRVPPGNEPSPSLEGSACLYVLLYPPPSSALLTPPSFYVGETESARQRLAQHRATHKKKSRIPESDLEALFVPVASKTEARNLEALLINALARRGFPLSSEADGRRAVGR